MPIRCRTSPPWPGERASVLGNLVGQGQDQADARLPVSGINVENVAADAFGFVGFVQQAVTLGLRQRAVHAVVRNRFKREHETSFCLEDMEQLLQGIEELVHHALFERNDRVLGDRDRLRTYLPAASRDVAVADVVLVSSNR